MWVDSHCHLSFPELMSDLSGVLARARNAGVCTMLTVNTKLEENPLLESIVEPADNLYKSTGIHPQTAGDLNIALPTDLVTTLAQWARHPKNIALGETGLDYSYEGTSVERQQMVFRAHMEAALLLDQPVIIHTRAAEEDTINMLQEYAARGLRGVMHCFAGSRQLAEQALSIGFYISFAGIVTFKNAEALREVAACVPLDRLLVETDAPYLAPVPLRGKTNEPAFVVHTGAKLAELLGVGLETLSRHTTHNFFKLFNRAKPTPGDNDGAST